MVNDQSPITAGAFTAERAQAPQAGDWRRPDDDFTTGLEANLALAEACGRSYHEATSESGDVDFWAHPIHPTAWTKHDLPPYASDLNAMHEAEKMLRPPYWNDFSIWQIYLNHFEEDPHATARQRAEAFLRAIGKSQEPA